MTSTSDPAAPDDNNQSDQALKLVEESTAGTDTGTPKNVEEPPSPAPAPVPPPAPIPAPAPVAPVEIPKTTTSTEPSFRDQINSVRAKAEPEILDLLNALDKYVDVMAPGKPMTPEDGVRNQYKLWEILHRTLEVAPLPLFPRMWNIVIAYFREYQNGAFAISHSNRFTEAWGRNLDHLAAYLELLDLLQMSATRPKLVSKLKSIEKVIALVYTDVGRGRLTSFYS